ncbi:MAG: EVE domain-containing protein [Longimicrobiales bacterium]|nr:EVE domain-containing protein [Longimicrobiales bacterium]
MAKQYWLMKSEEDAYSIRELEGDGTTFWDGVRSYEARNLMRDRMRVGDEVLFYHSNAKPSGVAGIARIAKGAYPDPSSFEKKNRYYDPKSDPENPRWFRVDLEFVEAFPEVVSLGEIKAKPELGKMALVKKPRLSVQPVTKEEFEVIRKMGRRR